MVSSPWRDQPSKAVPVGADKILLLDSEVGPGPLQQKLSTLTQVNSTFSASKLLIVKNQADLETQFGPDIEIPNTESWTVLYLESFIQTKPFRVLCRNIFGLLLQ